MRGKTNYARWLLCVMFVLIAGAAVSAHVFIIDPPDPLKIIYVDADADGLNIGTSWEHAVNSLQDALLLGYFSDNPVEIRVAQGIYTPDRGLGIMPGDSSVSFQLINDVKVKGGYAANSGGRRGQPDVRDINQYKCILSGDLDADDGPGLDTVKENSFHVITSSENDATAVLDGFTITGSGIVGGGTNPYNHSSGMYNDNSSPMLIDCNFTGNKAPEKGAGMHNNSSNPVLHNCKFNENDAPDGGAGMYNDNSSPMLTNCMFSGNVVGGNGAGMYNNNSKPILQNCIFTGNYAGMSGGGMYNKNSVPTLTNCTFSENSAGDDGGAIYSGFTDISLSDCLFEENRAADDGGGLSHVNGNIHLTGCTFVDNSALPAYQTTHSNNWGGAMLISITSGNQAVATDCYFRNNKAVLGGAIAGNLKVLRGCRFTGNVAYDRGGALEGRGMICDNCLFDGNKALVETAVARCLGTLLFTNCTFVDNRSPDGNAFIAYGGHGSLTENVFKNCIVWGAGHGLDPARSWLRKTSITYCNIQGSWPADGNIDEEPLFADPGYWEPNGTPSDPNDDLWIEGDYHLKSEAGRWDPNSESWVIDDVTSPCIDAGDPNSPVAFEPYPNGGIINMGAYGGMVEASISPSGIHAKYGDGTGEPNDPYLIYTAEQMNTIGTEPNDWDRHFKLMADIDLSGYTETNFNIIGNGLFPAFTGVFDGNGHTISNFTYSSTGEPCIGIFGYIYGPNARIINVGLIDPNVDGGTGVGVGSLAGWIDMGTITNCYVTGGNVTGKQQVGGLIGTSAGTITDCYAVGDRVTAEGYVGGFVGSNRGSIIDCYATGNVTGSYRVGGLAGANSGSIVDSYSHASVEGQNVTGGLAGYNTKGIITNCFSTSSVTGKDSVGGLVGENSGLIVDCYSHGSVEAQNEIGGLVGTNDGIVTASCSYASVKGLNIVGGLLGENSSGETINCYANGDVFGQRYVGGLVGSNTIAYGGHGGGGLRSGTIRNCYSVVLVSGDQDVGGLIGRNRDDEVSASFWDIEASGLTTSHGGVGKTALEMQDPNTFIDAGWDFAGSPGGPGDIWMEPVGGGYPVLMWQLSPPPELPVFSGGTGEPDDPYLISTADELNSIGHNPRLMNAHFKLINDIDLTGVDFYIMASQYYPFRGTFHGNDHTISNFSYTSPEATGVGLFGYVAGGQIKNLGLIDPNIHVDKGNFHGCLVGLLAAGTITHCYVESGSVTGQDELGGLVGENGSGGAIMNCYFTGEATGQENVGGLVGWNHGSITASYSYADVEGHSAVGGLVGRCSPGEIANCYAQGNVSGNWYVGGLVGSNVSRGGRSVGTILNCYSASDILRGSQKGGLLGVNWGTWSGAVYNCFWDVESSNQATSYGGEGKTTAEMQSAGTFLDTGWDFVDETENGTEDIWWIIEGQDYPRLWWESSEDGE